MSSVAIVAMLAMLLAFFALMGEQEKIVAGQQEVILYIDPPPWGEVKITVPIGLELPDRNPRR